MVFFRLTKRSVLCLAAMGKIHFHKKALMNLQLQAYPPITTENKSHTITVKAGDTKIPQMEEDWMEGRLRSYQVQNS